MPKINREEYEILKEALNEGYEWIARDSHNPLCTHRHKPIKQDHWIQQYWGNVGNGYKEIDDRLFQFIQWEDEEPYYIAELIEEYERHLERKYPVYNVPGHGNMVRRLKESEETEVSKQKLIDKWEEAIEVAIKVADFYGKGKEERLISYMKEFVHDLNQLDEPKQPKITLQDVTEKLWELPLNNRKLWLARLNDEFQEGYIVPLGLKTTDGKEQYLTYNGSYFASRRKKYLQQTFDKLEEIPEFYRELAERVL